MSDCDHEPDLNMDTKGGWLRSKNEPRMTRVTSTDPWESGTWARIDEPIICFKCGKEIVIKWKLKE